VDRPLSYRRQELNYRFIAQAIAELGYTGYVGHEYSPLKSETYLQSLKTAMEIFGA